MGTVTAQALINSAAFVLEDTGNATWSRAELLGWLNEGQAQTVAYAPGANVDRTNVALVPGTLQTLPDDTMVLMDIPRNVNGPAVRMVLRELLDAGPYDWHTAAPSATVKNYVYDPNDQYSFYVFPPNTGAGQVVAVYARVPARLTSEAQAIELDDSYAAAILNYMLFRAYSKDTDYVEDSGKAAAYFTAFKDSIANRGSTQAILTASNAVAPATPAVPGTLK